MFEIKNLTKKYKSKIKALDNISLDIENKGILFITGKIGSGKTTLLNILSGLDNSYTGEIRLYGETGKVFSKSRLGLYRNTCVGIVSNKYYVIDEFTVEKNMNMLLESTKFIKNERINEVLEVVELKGYKNSLVKDLGLIEKKKLYIALALIKNPNMLVIDEHTNILYDNFVEVMDILKKISNEKLVIIAIDNMNLAEKYADKIVELESGEIANITNKSTVKLGREMFELEKFKFSFSKMIKMILSIFGKKPVRLIITMLFMMISLTFFAVFTMIKDTDIKERIIEKMSYGESFAVTKEEFLNDDDYNLSDGDLKFLNNKYSEQKFYPVMKIHEKLNLTRNLMKTPNGKIWPNGTEMVMSYDEVLINDLKGNLIGNMPAKDDEIVITDLHFYLFKRYGYKNATEDILDYQDLIGKTFYGGYYSGYDKDYKIVGILNTNFDFKKYASLFFESSYETEKDRRLDIEANSLLRSGINGIFFVSRQEFSSFRESIVTSTNYHDKTDAYYPYSTFLSTVKSDKAPIFDMFKSNVEINGNGYFIFNKYSQNIEAIDYVGEIIIWPILLVGIVFLLFSMLLIRGFMNSSINYKKKEVARLRLLGASKTSIFSVYLFVSLIIFVIGSISSVVLLFGLSRTFNNILGDTFYLPEKYISFGQSEILMMIIISFFMIFLSVSKPIRKYMHQKMTDVIKIF